MNSRYANSCDCEKVTNSNMPSHSHHKSLAMAYVPWQHWENVMDGCNGLKHGSIFEDLILPFEGTKAACSPFSQSNNHYNNNYYRRGMK